MTMVWFSENCSWKMKRPTPPGELLRTGGDEALKRNPSTYNAVWGENSGGKIDYVKGYFNFIVSASSLCCWGLNIWLFYLWQCLAMQSMPLGLACGEQS